MQQNELSQHDLTRPKECPTFASTFQKLMLQLALGRWSPSPVEFSMKLLWTVKFTVMERQVQSISAASLPSYPYMVTYNISMILAFFNGVAYPATPNPKHGLVDRENYSSAFKLKLNRSCLFITFLNLSVIVTGYYTILISLNYISVFLIHEISKGTIFIFLFVKNII